MRSCYNNDNFESLNMVKKFTRAVEVERESKMNNTSNAQNPGLELFERQIDQYIKTMTGMTTGLIKVRYAITGQLVRLSASEDMKSRVGRFNMHFKRARAGDLVRRDTNGEPVVNPPSRDSAYNKMGGWFVFETEEMTFAQAQKIASLYEELGMVLMVRGDNTYIGEQLA